MQALASTDIAPFRMAKGLYFIGGREVSVHMLDTGAGLMLIDTGYPHMFERILRNIRALGFDPADIRAIVHSHGHYDHYGCTQRLKEMSGAATYISRIDSEIVNGTLNLSWADELGHARLPALDCDVLLEDGDVVSLGDVSLRCILTPGHTAGTLSFLFDIRDGGRRYTAAMHGGTGVNSMERAFLERHGLSEDCRELFRKGLHSLARLHVDIVLGNHPDQNDTEAKFARVLGGEADACIDPGEWPRFLRSCEGRLDAMICAEHLCSREEDAE